MVIRDIDSFSTVLRGKSPRAYINTGKAINTAIAATLLYIFILFSIILPPRNDNRYRLFRCNGNGINRAIHTAQMANLTIGWIFYFSLSLAVEPNYIGRACLYTYPTPDATINTFDSHNNFFMDYFLGLCDFCFFIKASYLVICSSVNSAFTFFSRAASNASISSRFGRLLLDIFAFTSVK